MIKKLVGENLNSKINFIKYIIAIISSILLFIFSKYLINLANHVVAFVMVVYSIFGLLELFSLNSQREEQHKFFYNFLILTLAIILVMLDMETQGITICTIWACWSILREEHELSGYGFNSGYHFVFRVFGFIESVAEIILSVFLIFHPTEENIMIHLILLGIELLTTGLIPIFNKLIVKETIDDENSN